MNGPMTRRILCIGSVLWDIIGRSETEMRQGSDVAGRISRVPGGVALNIAMTLARFGQAPVLLTSVGRDTAGEELLATCAQNGLDVGFVYRSDQPTDQYMAVEGANGVIAAIADAHSLEAAGDRILDPLRSGALGSADAPFDGAIALDGNLTADLLAQIARDPIFAQADMRIAPASPGKAERLRPFVSAGRGTLYVNLEEAGLLCDAQFEDAPSAARGLRERGAARVLVTDGAGLAAAADTQSLVTGSPPNVKAARLTGAGDTFMAAHIVAEQSGAAPDEALNRALMSAAAFVSGENPT